MWKSALILKFLTAIPVGVAMAAMDEDINKFAARPASNVPYLLAMGFVLLLGVIAVLGITMLLPNKDNTALITIIIGFLTLALGSLVTFLKSSETHLSVNSQMEEMKGLMKRVYYAEGVAEGRVPVVTVVTPAAPPGVVATAIDSGATVTIKKDALPKP